MAATATSLPSLMAGVCLMLTPEDITTRLSWCLQILLGSASGSLFCHCHAASWRKGPQTQTCCGRWGLNPHKAGLSEPMQLRMGATPTSQSSH